MAVSHDQIMETLMEQAGQLREVRYALERGGQQFRQIHADLAELKEKVEPVSDMQKDVAKTKDIVEAWDTAKNLGRFIKWASGLLVALGALWAVAKITVVEALSGRGL